MKVVILSGIPGSGKSTVAKGYSKAKSFSADHYFVSEDGVYRFDVTKLGEAHGECLRLFVEEVYNGTHDPFSDDRTLVVDNTNLSCCEIAPYVAIAQAYGLEIELVTVLCDPAIAAKRCVHGVPTHAVLAMARRLEERQLPDHWKYNEKFSQRTVGNY
jgi:predicted kinase